MATTRTFRGLFDDDNEVILVPAATGFRRMVTSLWLFNADTAAVTMKIRIHQLDRLNYDDEYLLLLPDDYELAADKTIARYGLTCVMDGNTEIVGALDAAVTASQPQFTVMAIDEDFTG